MAERERRDPGPPWQRTAAGMFEQSVDAQRQDYGRHHFEVLAEDSAFYRAPEVWKTFQDPNVTPAGKAAFAAGVLARDVLTDGSRRIWWYLNHPLAQTAAAGEAAARVAGMEPEYGVLAKQASDRNESTSIDHLRDVWAEEHGWARGGARRSGIPMEVGRFTLPAIAAGAMLSTSGNHNVLNALNGGRPAGHEALFHAEGDPTRSNNPIGEMAVRYLFGRQGDLLPWEQFTRERPEVSPTDYSRARAHQHDGGLLDLGLIKGTTRNLDGEPEYAMAGFRVPLSAAGTTVGALIGGAVGANMVSDAVGKALANKELQNRVRSDRLPEWIPRAARQSLARYDAPRRMAGAVLGALAGGVAGNLGTKAINAAVIQPVLHPAEVAAQRQWEQAQQALGLL